MRSLPLLLVSSVSLLLADVHAHASGLPVCSAKHKRPANLYGSVLSDGLKPVVPPDAKAIAAPKPTNAGAASPAPAPAVKAVQVSRSDLRASFATCRGDRA